MLIDKRSILLNHMVFVEPPWTSLMETPELSEFCKAIQKFREVMQEDLPLNEYERLSLENHFALLQMTYIEWKGRNLSRYRQAA